MPQTPGPSGWPQRLWRLGHLGLDGLVVQLGIAPPSLRGKRGVFSYLTVLALSLFGVARSAAMTYALALYGVALLSNVVASGARLAWLGWLPASRRPSHPRRLSGRL